MKLFLVKLKGLHRSNGVSYNESYVISHDPTSAYNNVRKFLDDKDYGFRHERELYSITLLADDKEYNDVYTRLFL